jgi:hypothetical protein
MLKTWQDFKNWLETKNPSLFAVVWAFVWRAWVIGIAIGLVLAILARLFS